METTSTPWWSSSSRLTNSSGEAPAYGRPDHSLFYIFDEPAKNFSADNVLDMFRIFQHTQSQVIITSAQRLDYGDDDLTVNQLFLQAEP
jgi:hypothetical protein